MARILSISVELRIPEGEELGFLFIHLTAIYHLLKQFGAVPGAETVLDVEREDVL